MLYDLIHNFAFVHAPRSAGTRIQQTLMPYLSEASVVDLLARRHWTARQMRDLVGRHIWPSLYS